MKTLTASAAHYYARFQIFFSLLSFVAGFGLSLWQQRPIDTDWALATQALTLLVLFGFILGELAWRGGAWTPSPRLANWWRWHELVQHFLLGGLLRSYAVFFIKSGGANGSLVFLVLLTLVLLANELPMVQNRGTLVRTILWALALSCFLTYLVPRLMHNLGPMIFTLSVGLAALLILIADAFMRPRVTPQIRKNFFLWPGLATLTGYLLLYHLALIPPVPLMLARLDVVHIVQKGERDWLLFRAPQEKKFWSENPFPLRPGDKAVMAFKLVAPPLFVEELRVRWQWKTPQGWRETDAIAVKIQGGRKDGFRGTTEKSHLWPGDWRVLLETKAGREIGRLRFHVLAHDGDEPLLLQQEVF
jgi:hypothetical protein